MTIGELKQLTNTDGFLGSDSNIDSLVRLAITQMYSDIRTRYGMPWWMRRDTILAIPAGSSTHALPADFYQVETEVYVLGEPDSQGIASIHGYRPTGQVLPYVGDSMPWATMSGTGANTSCPIQTGYFLRYGKDPIIPDPAAEVPPPNPQGGEAGPGTLFCLTFVSLSVLRLAFTYIRQVAYDQDFDSTNLNYFMPDNVQAALQDSLRVQMAKARPLDQALKPQVLASLRTEYDRSLSSAIKSINQPAPGPGRISYSH